MLEKDKNISLLFEYIPQNESYIIQGDTMLLMRMIYNLIENAINYGINGGCVWVNLIKNQESTDIIDHPLFSMLQLIKRRCRI